MRCLEFRLCCQAKSKLAWVLGLIKNGGHLAGFEESQHPGRALDTLGQKGIFGFIFRKDFFSRILTASE